MTRRNDQPQRNLFILKGQICSLFLSPPICSGVQARINARNGTINSTVWDILCCGQWKHQFICALSSIELVQQLHPAYNYCAIDGFSTLPRVQKVCNSMCSWNVHFIAPFVKLVHQFRFQLFHKSCQICTAHFTPRATVAPRVQHMYCQLIKGWTVWQIWNNNWPLCVVDSLWLQ